MRPNAFVTGSLAVVLAGSLFACGDDGPTRPTPPGGGNPPPPSSPTLVRITVDGPASIAPGESGQFTATGQYSDGSTRNVTTETGISWRTSDSRVLSILPSGVATGGDRGEASITAVFSGRSAVKSGVLVLPPGTYRLMGTVTDTGFPLSNVRVEVTHGPATGMVTIASPTYRLYGVSGDTELRVQKDGYRDERPRIQVTNHHTENIEMVPSRPRENVRGTYTLTVIANDVCRGRLPDEAMRRTYTATLEQQGPQVVVTLSGTSFLTSGGNTYNRFTGMFDSDRLRFSLSTAYDYYGYQYEYPNVIASLTPSTYTFLMGTAVTTATQDGLSGAMTGVVGTMEGPPRLAWQVTCASTHQLVFSRLSSGQGSWDYSRRKARGK